MSIKRKITVCLAEDHLLIGDALEMLLEKQEWLKILDRAADGVSTISMVEKLKPDVLVMDVVLPRGHGFEVIHQLHRQTKIVAISVRKDDLFVAQTIKNGALAY